MSRFKINDSDKTPKFFNLRNDCQPQENENGEKE